MAGDLLPYLKFYPAETLADERYDGWSFAERGLWQTLLFKCWVNGSIPSNVDDLARTLHVSADELRPLWDGIKDRFIPHPDQPGRLTSRRLEYEREDAHAKSSAGKKGAASRWNRVQPDPDTMRPQCDRNATASEVPLRPPMPAEQSNAEQHNAAHPRARAARLGVGHPAFEAVEHWTKGVWPKTSTAECPEVTTAQTQSLAALCGRHTPAAVMAAMDRAAADPFWADKLELDTFIAKFGRFLHDKDPPAATKQRVTAEASEHSKFGKGEVAL